MKQFDLLLLQVMVSPIKLMAARQGQQLLIAYQSLRLKTRNGYTLLPYVTCG